MQSLIKLPLLGHLNELRYRLILIILFIIIFFLLGLFFSKPLLKVITDDTLTENAQLIVTTPLEFIYAQIKVAFLFSLIIACPLILYELILFIRPALTLKEKNAVKLTIPSFLLLFLLGISFSYFIFLKIALFYLSSLALGVASNLWSLNRFIDFIFITSISFGLIFQLPLIMLLLKKLNILNIDFMKKNRKYIYIILMIIAAIITPSDILTMILLVVPLIILYELSLVLVRLF